MISKLKSIIQGYTFLLLSKWGLITDEEILSMVSERVSKCMECPLFDNGWCSGKRSVIMKEHRQGRGYKYKKISGCNCWLAAKWFVKDEHCPLERWQERK